MMLSVRRTGARSKEKVHRTCNACRLCFLPFVVPSLFTSLYHQITDGEHQAPRIIYAAGEEGGHAARLVSKP